MKCITCGAEVVEVEDGLCAECNFSYIEYLESLAEQVNKEEQLPIFKLSDRK